MMWGWDGGVGAWLSMGIMMFFGLLVTVGVIVMAVWVLGSATRGTGGVPWSYGEDRAVEEARRRYAGGEITKDQYEEMLRTLRR